MSSFLEDVLISCDPNFMDHTINPFVDQDPVLGQMTNGQHEEIGWNTWLNKDFTRLFIAKLDEAWAREKAIIESIRS